MADEPINQLDPDEEYPVQEAAANAPAMTTPEFMDYFHSEVVPEADRHGFKVSLIGVDLNADDYFEGPTMVYHPTLNEDGTPTETMVVTKKSEVPVNWVLNPWEGRTT